MLGNGENADCLHFLLFPQCFPYVDISNPLLPQHYSCNDSV